jgi:hypothetical protein
MKHTALLFAFLLLLACSSAAVGPGNVAPPKVDVESHPPAGGPRVGGEDIPNAVPITEFPFLDTGNTCLFWPDYDEMCPYGSNSSDVVYSFTPWYDMCVDISLCDSFYDTKVYVYEGGWVPGVPYACNDDSPHCYDPPHPYPARIRNLMMWEGLTYYIVVDGYGNQCGDYVLSMFDCVTMCPVECPPDGVDEGEGPCYDGYVDHYNAGCNVEPYVFQELEPSDEVITICGMSGNYNYNGMRDTDWYMLNLTCEETTITACVEAEFPVMMGFVDLREGCDNVSSFYSYVTGELCTPACLTETLPPGEWVIWVSTWGFPDYPCDDYWVHYNLTIEGYDACVPVEGASWSTIKGIYR